jgi:hypothetical protein
MVEFLKKYKTQIINVITIFLILEFAIYPGLTTANTISNILAGIGLLLLIVWGGLALYQYVTSDKKQLSDEETKQKLESELGPVIDDMAKEILADKPKKKRNPKQTAPIGTDETAPFVKTRKKATKKTK